ncbi:MAG: L-threonylcarbamoyladenylate synthase [Thermoleophilaceae bacterium]
MGITAEDAAELERCVAVGGLVLFPADTVYGLACDPSSRPAVERLYAMKGRAGDRPAAVMFFQLEALARTLPELGERARAALTALLPGPVTAVVPNPERRFPLAAGPEPERLGVRVPALPPALGALRSVAAPLLQSSANPSGEPDARRLEDVDAEVRAGVDLELDGGELPGAPSTVVDLSAFEETGEWAIRREGAVAAARVAELLRR